MQLKTLISKIEPIAVEGRQDCEIMSISYDSRRVQAGGLFVALRGEKVDGHNFIEPAIEKGAFAVVEEGEMRKPNVTMVRVKDTRKALADLDGQIANLMGAAAPRFHLSTHSRE